MTCRILVAGSKADSLYPLRDSLKEQFADATVDSTLLLPGSPFKLPQSEYNAVVCRVDALPDLSWVRQFHGAKDRVPILVVGTDESQIVQEQAIAAGASSFVACTRGFAAIREHLEWVLKLEVQTRRHDGLMSRSLQLKDELGQLLRESKELRSASRQLSRKPALIDFLPLIVLDDPDQAFLLIRAIEKADVFAPLPLLRNVEQAIAYLSGNPPFADRYRHPLPTAVLLDVGVEPNGGFEILSWIRQQELLKRLPVLMLSTSDDPELLKRSYELKANSYLVKPTGLDELADMIRAIAVYWSRATVAE